MSGTRTINEHVTHTPRPATVDLKLEVVAIPVSDVDRAKAFYENLGWTLDADFMVGKNFRAVQLTPPGSPCSIHLATTGVPGSAKGCSSSSRTSTQHAKISSLTGPRSATSFISTVTITRCQVRVHKVSLTCHTPRSRIQTAING